MCNPESQEGGVVLSTRWVRVPYLAPRVRTDCRAACPACQAAFRRGDEDPELKEYLEAIPPGRDLSDELPPFPEMARGKGLGLRIYLLLAARAKPYSGPGRGYEVSNREVGKLVGWDGWEPRTESVIAAARSLESAGLIDVERHPGRSSVFRVHRLWFETDLPPWFWRLERQISYGPTVFLLYQVVALAHRLERRHGGFMRGRYMREHLFDLPDDWFSPLAARVFPERLGDLLPFSPGTRRNAIDEFLALKVSGRPLVQQVSVAGQRYLLLAEPEGSFRPRQRRRSPAVRRPDWMSGPTMGTVSSWTSDDLPDFEGFWSGLPIVRGEVRSAEGPDWRGRHPR